MLDIFLFTDAYNEEPDDGDEKRRQEVERLAVLEVEQAETTACDHQSAHDEEFGHEGIADGCAADLGNHVEHALPEEQHWGGQYHAQPVCRGEDGAADEVERGVGEEEGVVALQGRDHWSQHRQGADAVEEDGRTESVAESGFALAFRALVDESLEAPVDVEPRAEDAANGQCHNEEHGVLALGQVGDGGVEADGERCQAKTCIEYLLIAILDAAIE